MTNNGKQKLHACVLPSSVISEKRQRTGNACSSCTPAPLNASLNNWKMLPTALFAPGADSYVESFFVMARSQIISEEAAAALPG
jgi:hypothetical protein